MRKLLIIGALLLSGCAGAVPWNDQENAGITDVHVYWGYDKSTGVSWVKEIRVTDGKEQGAIDFKFAIGETVLSFAADQVKAFEGQALRAEVEKVVAEQVGEVSSEAIDAIMNVLKPNLLGNQ